MPGTSGTAVERTRVPVVPAAATASALSKTLAYSQSLMISGVACGISVPTVFSIVIEPVPPPKAALVRNGGRSLFSVRTTRMSLPSVAFGRIVASIAGENEPSLPSKPCTGSAKM